MEHQQLTDILPVQRSGRDDESVPTRLGLGQGQDVSFGDVADLRERERRVNVCQLLGLFQFSLRFGPLGWPTYINPVAHSFLEIVIRLLALGESPEVRDRGAARLSKERLISLGHSRDSLYGNTAGGD
jgi:hypothetical protein